MALKKIPERDQNLMCASFYVNSFKRAIEELVYNSLDAESTSIAIRVCIEKKYIQVLDNGTGIAKDNFRFLGDKYVSSKFIDVTSLKSIPNKYGFKGISLASIIEISENVKISSKFQNSQETWIKMFCKGCIEEFSLATLRPSKGTTVEVSGFLYNLNIQQKSIDLLNEINSIKLALEQLSLVHCNISLSLRDDSKNEIIFKIHKNRNISQTLWLLCKISSSDVQDLQVEKNEYKVKAYIGKNSLMSKRYQWIYLNGRIVNKSFLHKKINETLTKKLCIKTINNKKEKFTDESDFCKIPFYFIFISCPNFDFDIIYNNKQTFVEFKNCDKVNKLIEKLIDFHCGDMILKPVNVGVNKNNNDTRKKVKEIMEKILNKNQTKANITYLQNGRKGKNIKRKNTSQRTKKKSKDNCIETKQLTTVTTKDLDRKSVSKMLNNKNLEIKYPSINNNKRRNQPKSKNPYKSVKTTLKPYLYDDTLIKHFTVQTEIVKKRCQKLSYEVKRLLKKTYFDNRYLKSSESIAFNIVANKFVSQYCETVNKNLVKKQLNTDNKNATMKQLKTSYDLLKTTEDNEMLQINTFSENKNIVIKDSGQSYEKLISDLTFNSHKRTVGLNNKILQQFPKRNSQNNNSISLLKAAILTEYKNRSMINICNNNNKDVKSQDNFTCDSEKNNNVTNSFNYNMSYIIKFNFENTNTIDVLSSLCATNDAINKTYSIQMSTNLSCSNHITKTLPTIKDTVKNTASSKNKNGKSVFISESESSDKFIEPLKYCDAILGSNELRDVEREFDISFLDNEKRDSVVNIIDNNSTKGKVGAKSLYLCDESNNIVILEDNYQTEQPILNTVQKEIPNMELLKKLKLTNNYLSLGVLNSDTNNTDDFELKSRHNFVPKGMSQIFKNKVYKNAGIYTIDEQHYKDAIYIHFADDVRDKFEIYEPDVKNVKDIVLKDLNKINYKNSKNDINLIFNSESLKQAKILRQIDRKFIVARIQSKCSQVGNSSEFLALFDQHAVDERIRLEKNLSDYFDGIKWKSVPVEAINLKINKEDYYYLYNYKEKFSQLGLQWSFTDNDVLIHAVPKAILGKNPRKAAVIFTAVRRIISEQIEVIKSIRGNVSLYPKSIMELVFSEACRYAIKFGDQLSKIDCSNMISTLSTCKIPFQCAHGRPVMAIIMELPNSNRSYKGNLSNIKKFKRDCLNNKIYDEIMNKE